MEFRKNLTSLQPAGANDKFAQGANERALMDLHKSRNTDAQYMGEFDEREVTINGVAMTILARNGGAAGDVANWSVAWVSGGINISVPVCTFPGNTPTFKINGRAVDHITRRNNFLPVTGRKLIVLKLTVNDTSPVQIYITEVTIVAVDESDPLTNTATTRWIPIRGVDADTREISPSWLSGAIQVRRWGNRNDVNNLIWQVT